MAVAVVLPAQMITLRDVPSTTTPGLSDGSREELGAGRELT
jgi:hypothetical protein